MASPSPTDAPALGQPYHQAAALIAAVKNGEVLLLRGTWVLDRAGYRWVEVEANKDVSRLDGSPDRSRSHGHVERERSFEYALRNSPRGPLPTRQQVEAEHRNAIMPAAELEQLESAHMATLKAIEDAHCSTVALGFKSIGIIAVSQVWHHADPKDETLAAVGKQLAVDLPKMFDLGWTDVGVFIDVSGRYQDVPVERSRAEEAHFQKGLANASLWFAHRLVTVYIVRGPDDGVLIQEAQGEEPRVARHAFREEIG